ncbi:unnamed protein product [Rotaria sp. Silwood1]|nr:unnamed protein product [Rotaria sp. Silwood1]
MTLMANNTNNINFNITTNSRPNTNPLPHRDLLQPKKLTSRLGGIGTTQDSSFSSDSNSIYRQVSIVVN